MEEVICGISTSVGNNAISIIRISGKDTISIVNKIFSKNINNVESHTINYGYIKNNNEIIDEVLLMLMKAPKTYTTEDIIEINCHGGISTTNKVLELLLENGCRLAEPGEFTKRAFLNGRIDLTKAEAVNDLLNSKTDKSRDMAMNAINGRLYNKINDLREDISKVLSNIEVNIDYPEYTDEIEVTDSLIDKYLIDINKKLKQIIIDSESGQIIKNGIKVAIIGRPNVGKSSLLNAFLDENKAIVTNIPGTTRDIVEGSIKLSGIELHFIDTAGIRNTEDIVEKIGVEKSIEISKTADLVIIVLNNNEKLTEEDSKLINNISNSKKLIFVNKNDLEQKLKIEEEVIYGNTMSLNGIEELKDKIVKKLKFEEILSKDLIFLGNIRQINLVKKASKSLENAINGKENNMPIDLIEIDIKNAWQYLGELTGEFYEDELVDKIFSNFCLGK